MLYSFFKSIWDKLYTNYTKVKHLIVLYKTITTEVSIAPSSLPFKIVGNHAVLCYTRLNKEYKLYVPYNRMKSLSSDITALLVKNGKEINITQQPGIPYLVSANDLGGEKIILTNNITGSSFDYFDDKIPMYGDEISQ